MAKGEIDVAVVWGPLAGYFAKRQGVPLEVVPVSPSVDPPGLPFAFALGTEGSKLEIRLNCSCPGI